MWLLCYCVVVDCGSPELPSNAAVLAAAEGTDGSSNTEGATVSFQCEEGLTPSHPINITCTSISNTGLWRPDPAVQCSDGIGMVYAYNFKRGRISSLQTVCSYT